MATRSMQHPIPPMQGPIDGALLMRSIKESDSWQELANVVERHGQSSFNLRHTSAAITHLAQLKSAALSSENQPPLTNENSILYQALLTEILDLTNAFLLDCGARQLANILWAIAHLMDEPALYCDTQSSRILVSELHATSLKILPLLQPLFKHCEPQHFSTVAWASAKLSLEPDDEWLESFLVHSEKCIDEFQPQHLGNSIWGLARLGICPDPAWIKAFLSAVDKRRKDLLPIDISHILLGLATLEFDPHHNQSQGSIKIIHSLLEALLSPPSEQPKANPQAIANSCWAMATMKVIPTQSWTERLVRDFDRRMKEYRDPQAISTFLWSLASLDLGASVPIDTMQLFYKTTLPLLPSFEPRSLSNTLWAIASFHSSSSTKATTSRIEADLLRPPNEWMTALLSSFQRQLPMASDQATSNIMWSVAKLKMTLAPELASSMIQHLHALDTMGEGEWRTGFATGPGAVSGQSLSNSLWAMAKLGFRLSHDAQAVFVSMVERRINGVEHPSKSSPSSPFFRPSELASVLYSFAAMGVRPPDHVALALLSLVAHNFTLPGSPSTPSTLSPRDISNVSWAIATLRLEPDEAFVKGLWSTASQSLSSFKPKDLAQTTYSLAKIGWSVLKQSEDDPSSSADLLLSQAISSFPHCSSQDISNLSWGLAQMDLKPSQAWCSYLSNLLCQRGDSLLASDLATALWALGKMKYEPKPKSLLQVEVWLYRKMPSLKPRELAACAWSFSAMHYTPNTDWLDAFAQHCMLLAADFTQQDWTVVVYSLASIAEGEKDAVIYLEDLFISPQLEAQMHKFAPNTLAMLTYSCGVLGTKSARLLGRLLAAARPHLMSFKANELCALICTAARLNIVPESSFLTSWLETFEQRIPTLAGSALSTSAWALASLGVSPRAELQHLLSQVLDEKLDSLLAQEVSMVVWALGEWSTPLSPQFVARLGTKVGSFSDSYSRVVRRNLGWALMKLKSKSKATAKKKTLDPWERKEAGIKKP